ncbi:hypothetical protein KC973_01495, partial [Candidatus Saccharibacteria bacterium]|nr:hypothetical protein [Candidatus Saccharibacteria bacterium]
ITVTSSAGASWTTQNNVSVHGGYIYYAYYFNVYFLLYIAVLLRKMLANKRNKLVKRQILFFIVTISLTTLFAFIPNLILPNYFSKTTLLWIGPLSAALFASLISYSIVKHRLFDIRLVVARTMAYLLSVGVLVAAYLVVVLGLGQLISIGPELNNAQRTFYVLIAFLFAVTLNPLKRVFDKLTNRVFYRDAYDTQEILDKVSSVIVGNVDPIKLQMGALDALHDAVKPTFTSFVLIDHSLGTLKIGRHAGQSWDPKNTEELAQALKRVHRPAVFEEVEHSQSKLRETLRKADIGLVVPMVTKDEKIGYIVCGAKKSGNTYNSQDVGLLNIAANELAVALQNAQRFEEIQAFNITLQEKVNEATKELKSTNKKLVALDEAKDEFISMASHQLRTPLTSIKGYLSMILDGDMGKLNKNQTQALKEAFGSSQRMVFLISDFLNVSRIKTGKFVIEPKEIDLAEMVGEELKQLTEMADSRDIKLKYDQPGEFPLVKLDDNKIRQVMMNMVDNAIYYTPAGGTVTIQLMVDGKDVVFKVIDTGIGVPKSEQHKLFTKFFRAGNAKVARPDGTGLGLFMAQKIIVAQNGSIIFESEEGKGSTFGFRFPLKSIKA